ncbi:MAG: hypothetical protein WBP26_03790 [Candidatus Saccharimonadales bacterium]
MKKILLALGVALGLLAAIGVWFGLPAAAQQGSGEFSLQVTPSPLVTTIKPGVPTEVELRVRNAGGTSEELKIEPRAFSFNSTTGEVELQDTTPPDIAEWISFSSPVFTVKPGEWFSQKIKFSLPKETGFSYSFALVITRKNNPQPTSEGRLLRGSVAVFTLVNVDRPGATRILEVPKFVATKRVFEYLPATFTVEFKNSGNSIVQPYGNIFVQRGSNDTQPLATLPVNETRGYILPDTSRSLESNWTNGFPAYEISKDASGKEVRSLKWNFANASEFRFGRYTAKLVAAYNDGQRDIPLVAEVTFWVIPWKILLGVLIVLLLIGAGIWAIIRKLVKTVQRKKSPKSVHKKSEPKQKTPDMTDKA